MCWETVVLMDARARYNVWGVLPTHSHTLSPLSHTHNALSRTPILSPPHSLTHTQTRRRQHSALNTQDLTLNTQHSTLNNRDLTLNTQHSTLNTQHSTLNTQHSTLNRERERERERESQKNRVCQGTFDPRGKDTGERHVSGRFALQGYLAHKKQPPPT